MAVVERASYGKLFTGSSNFLLDITHVISAHITLARVNHMVMLNDKDYTLYTPTIPGSQRVRNIGG